MTSLTSRSTGAIPLLTSQRPKTFARWTSQAARLGPGTLAEILMLDAHGTIGSGRQSRLLPASGLNAGLLIRGNYVVVGTERSALPHAFVEIEDRNSFVRKVGIAREDPASMLPWTKSIAAE